MTLRGDVARSCTVDVESGAVWTSGHDVGCYRRMSTQTEHPTPRTGLGCFVTRSLAKHTSDVVNETKKVTIDK